jgi:acyl-CoA reductase-like NAD-dependent aldehyde dehydrogenase
MSEQPTITPEQKAALEKETQDQLKKMADQQIAEAIEKAKAEAKAEFEAALKAKEQENQVSKLAAELEAQKKMLAEKELQHKQQLDNLTASKAKITYDNPFVNKSAQPSGSVYEYLLAHPDKYKEAEEKARIEFFGR